MRDFVPVRRLTSGERVAFCSHLGWPPRPPIPRPLFYGRGGRRAQPPGGEGSWPHHNCATAYSLPWVIQKSAKKPGALLAAAGFLAIAQARDGKVSPVLRKTPLSYLGIK